MKISVRVNPRAKKEGVEKGGDGVFVVKVSTPPEGGRANERVTEILAEYFGVPKKGIVIRVGATSRNKIVEVEKN